jgi:photosystem II stability/assembly factor-like uncharacterized protein
VKADITRSTFRRTRHYSGVRLQQGRVQIDADFNEQVDITAHREHVTTADVIGPSGVPETGGGFKLGVGALLESVAVAGTRAVVAGERSTVLASGNGGASWTHATTPGTADLHAAAIADDTHGWVVGNGGTVLAGNPASGTWSARTSGVTAALRGVHFRDTLIGAAVGDGGTLIESVDGGTTWSAASVATTVAQDLYSVHLPAANKGWAVGNAGRILARGTGGWSVQAGPTGFSGDLRGVHFADATHGWAVGRGAAILSTSDGGATWTKRPAPLDVTVTLRSVAADSTTSVWAAGDYGTLLHSGDGGATWSVVAVPASLDADLYDVAARGTGQPALVVGDASTIGTAPAGGGGTLALVTPPAAAVDLTVSPGRIYVDGILCESERTVRYGAQPDLPGAPAPGADGTRLVYLDVWEHHVTALEDPDLREVALGGPDTATRTKTVWQVRVASPADTPGASCDAIPDGWSPASRSSSGRMRAHTDPALALANECMVPAAGGYRRLENQLYRVELHDVSAHHVKWSRDNGSVVARLKRIEPDTNTHASGTLTLAQPGRDAVTGFAGAEYVELTDEGRVLRGEHGVMLEVDPLDSSTLHWHDYTGAASDLDTLAPDTIVRRWDGIATAGAAGTQVALEGGIWVEFDAGTFQDGDYWTIPARTRTGEVEWPDDGGEPRWMPRQGVEHHYTPLGFATFGGGRWSGPTDCRNVFPPLGNLVRMFMAGGDGQEAVPDPSSSTRVPLDAPLEVGVMRGNLPVVGASVRFTIVGSGGGGLGGTQDPQVTVPTGSDGLAQCQWWLGPTERSQQVRVELLRRNGQPWQVPLQFDASLSVAGAVAYDPKDCTRLKGTKNVQEALDVLCKDTGSGGGTCTVSAFPGDDLQAAVESLPADGGELCLAAGEYVLDKPLRVSGRTRVQITGRGPATVLRVRKNETAVAVKGCDDLALRSLRVEGAGGIEPPGDDHLRGTITFRDCTEVRVSDCEVLCRPAAGRARTCISFYGPELLPPEKEEAGAEPRPRASVRVERTRLETGAFQTGLLIVNADEAVVDGNRVFLADVALEAPERKGKRSRPKRPPRGKPTPLGREDRVLMDFQRDEIAHAVSLLVKAKPVAGGPVARDAVSPSDQPTLSHPVVRPEDLAGTAPRAALMSVRNPRGAAGLVESIDAIRTRLEMRSQPKDKREAAARTVDSIVGRGGREVPEPVARSFVDVSRELLAVGQGIVVAGDHAGTVQVVDNIVDDAIQGIHVGLSDRAREGRERGRELEVSRNVVHSLIPYGWQRERHAVFVGNVDSIAISDTRAVLARPLSQLFGEATEGRSRVDAVRVYGQLGPYMVVRGTSVEGYNTGVHVVPTPDPGKPNPDERTWLWYVTETMAVDAGAAVEAPDSVARGINAP